MIVVKVLIKHKQRGRDPQGQYPNLIYNMHIIACQAEGLHVQNDNYIQTWTCTPKFPADTSTKSKFSTKTRLWVASVTACLAAQGD